MARINIEAALAQAVRMIPKFYELDSRVLSEDEDIFNWLEDVVYNGKAGEIVLRGTMGEQWIIPEKKLAKYENLDGSDLLYPAIPADFTRIQTRMSGTPAPVWMIKIPLETKGEVITERGDTLKVNCPVNRRGQNVPHADGDFIVCCDDNGRPAPEWGCWVVNGCVVEKTYRPA